MDTDRAKLLAESRHAFMEQFLNEWEQETGKTLRCGTTQNLSE